jgi:hypothetical protein
VQVAVLRVLVLLVEEAHVAGPFGLDPHREGEGPVVRGTCSDRQPGPSPGKAGHAVLQVDLPLTFTSRPNGEWSTRSFSMGR